VERKVALKAAAGVVLALALAYPVSAGYARWTDESTNRVATVATGGLKLTKDATQVYNITALQNPHLDEEGTVVFDKGEPALIEAHKVSDYVFVPGSTLRLVTPLHVELTGRSLKGELKVNIDRSLQDGGFEVKGLALHTTDTGASTTPLTAGSSLVQVFPSTDIQDFYLIYEIAFDDDNTVNDDSQMNRTIPNLLNGITVSLNQIGPKEG